MCAFRVPQHGPQPVRRDGFGLALQLERLDRLGLDRVAHEGERLVADQDLARLRGLLEAGGDVDGVAGGEALLGSGHDLAGVDADAGLHAQLRQRGAHLHRRAARAQGVVLVHLGDAEHGHDRIADELLDRPAVRLDDPLHALEVAGEQGAQRLGVGRLAQGGRAGDVAEEDGDGLALLASGRRGLERRAARVAETRPFRVLRAAARTRGHAAPHSFGFTCATMARFFLRSKRSSACSSATAASSVRPAATSTSARSIRASA